MSTPSLTRLRNSSFGAKKEGTSYTYEAPDATDGITVRQDVEVNLNREFLEDDTIVGTLSHSPSEPGMWSDDLGGMLPVYARSGGNGTVPEFSVLMENAFGSQVDNADETVDDDPAMATTTTFTLTGATTYTAGQLILVDIDGNDTFYLTQVQSQVGKVVTVWPPLPDDPDDLAPIKGGTNFMLLDDDWPLMSVRCQFEGTKYIKYKGCRVSQMEATFEVGQRVPINFTFVAAGLEGYGHEAETAFTANLDNTTRFLTCLGVELSAMYEGTAKGVPTTTETVLSTPDFAVAVGDELIAETATEWETVTISNVSGAAGEDITLTHAALTAAVSADDTVYVRRKKCASSGDSLTITLENTITPVNCMAETYGKVAIEQTGRMVTIAKNPFWMSWQELLLRDNAIGSALTVFMGTEENKIMVWYLPNIQNTEVSITSEELMRTSVTSVANKDATLGGGSEIVVACF